MMGSFIQWDHEAGLSTGRTQPFDQREVTAGIVRFETMLLDTDPQLDAGKLSIAKTLILSSNLPQDLRNWCARKLEKTA
jgi:hypothetical protein